MKVWRSTRRIPFEEGGGTDGDRAGHRREGDLLRPDRQSFSAEVGEIKALDPDAIVLIGFDESAKVVNEMVKQGIGPNSE